MEIWTKKAKITYLVAVFVIFQCNSHNEFLGSWEDILMGFVDMEFLHSIQKISN